jgi:hypothetical protein
MRLPHTNSRRILRAAGSLSLLSAVLLGSACNSADTTTTNSANYTNSVALSADSVAVSIGDSSNLAITITRGGGYTDAVTLAIDTVPVGITATYSSQVINTGATASILTLAAGPSAVVGTTFLKLRVTGFAIKEDTLTIRLIVAPRAISVTAGTTVASAFVGGSATIPITFERLNGFKGAIFPTAEGVPANVTATFTPALVPNGVTSTTLVLSPIVGAVPGTSTITIRAAGGSGVVDKTTPIAFTIMAPSLADFAPSASPAAITLVTGSAASSAISLNRVGGLASNVSFTLAGLPAGVTAAFSSNPTSAASTTLTLTATNAVALGKYNLTLTGTALSGPSHTIPLVLTVAQPASIIIALVKPTLTISKASVGQSAFLITRAGGLVGDITFSIDSLSTGVTSQFAPAVLTGSMSAGIVGFSVASTAISGTYTIVVRGTTVSGVTGASTITVIVP